MNSVQNISVIVPITVRNNDLQTYIESVKRSLAYISYTRNKPLQYEIIFVTNNASYISSDERALLQSYGPISFHDESKHAGDALLFQKGISYANYAVQIFLNANLKIAPEALGDAIIKVMQGTDVVVTISGSQRDTSLLAIQKNTDAKALIFTKEVSDSFQGIPFLDKTYIIEFLRRANEAGFSVLKYQNDKNAQSVLSPFAAIKNTVRAGLYYLSVKFKKVNPIHTASTENNSMINAGVRYKKQKFITHSTLSFKDSAINSFTLKQILLSILFIDLVLLGLRFDIILLAQITFAILSVFYLVDVLFNFFLVFKTVKGSSELSFSKNELDQLEDSNLPIYTILCPLYKEAHMLGHFLDGIAKIEWPPEKLDVLLLLEEDDTESIETIARMDLPGYVRTLVVPTSQPKTKPKACNYGLAFARGEFVVIFDAEDIPDPLQLKKAYLGFKSSDRNVVCLQAKLNYHNSTQNLLTRFFTAEYSWLFDISLPGLQSLNTIIPLGGTSNHFRKADLITLQGWDPFNVTEDADLGLRIYRLGYRTAILDSVTLEEANSNVLNWIRQRSRWVKGYMQTYLVHTRDMLPLLRARGPQALMLHFVIGGRILFIFVNPLLWIVTISYFSFKAIVGPVLEETYSPIILYTAVISLVLGNYLYILGYVLGCVKREQWSLIKYVFLIPFYLLLISVAGCMAFYQLLFKPYYWEKTVHGLHLKKQEEVKNNLKVPNYALPKFMQKQSAFGGN
ncbi:MAG: glycosyltransferase [Candidatus Levybacteria bacterium]|nr:glycosyltransferase [Candidatus Levybacteria bacterium]